MTVRTNAGTRFFIGPANEVANTEGAYSALVYTEVGEVEDHGSFGDNFGTTPFVAVGDERERNLKTIKRGVQQSLVVGYDSGDAGQIAMAAAVLSKSNYAVKIVRDNGSEGSPPGTGETFYFRGLLTGGEINLGNAENVVRQTIMVMKNSDTVRVAAT